MELLFIFIGSVLVNNFVLVQFLGICPFLGVSKQLDTAFGMGMATTFVLTVSSVATWLLNRYILVQLGIPYLRNVMFILVIAVLVQLVEMFLKKVSPVLYRALGIFLPLITTNCAILGLALIIAQREYNLIQSIVFSLGAGLGFTLALVIMAGIRQELRFSNIPKCLQGSGIALIVAGLLSLAFMGFSGIVPV